MLGPLKSLLESLNALNKPGSSSDNDIPALQTLLTSLQPLFAVAGQGGDGAPPRDAVPADESNLIAPVAGSARTNTPTATEKAETTRAEAEAYLKNPNVSAFLDTIAWAEGASYDTLYGGARFGDYSRFPGYGKHNTPSGRYQIVAKTYDGLSKALGLTDFSPHTQDLMAVQLLRERGALQPLLSGDLDAVLPNASRIWASLPQASDKAGRYNQPYKPYDAVRSTFERLKLSR